MRDILEKGDDFTAYKGFEASELTNYSRLSRVVTSDAFNESDHFEGFLEKKSPTRFVGWQVNFYLIV
jgi:hypothetical protein